MPLAVFSHTRQSILASMVDNAVKQMLAEKRVDVVIMGSHDTSDQRALLTRVRTALEPALVRDRSLQLIVEGEWLVFCNTDRTKLCRCRVQSQIRYPRSRSQSDSTNAPRGAAAAAAAAAHSAP